MSVSAQRRLFLHVRPGITPAAEFVNRIRLDQPSRALVDAGLANVLSENPTSRLYRHQDAVFIYGRCYFPDHSLLRQSIRLLTDHDYMVVMEIDDHPDGMEGHRDDGYYTLGSMHAIQTSTPELAAFLVDNKIHSEVAVFPNQLASLPPRPVPRRPGRVRLVFAALERGPSWQMVLPALNRALAELGDAVRCGVIHDRALFDALETPHKRLAPLMPYDRYCAALGQSDIHILPLADTPFNRAKSDLKFIESAAQGTVCLASPVVYANTIRHDETGVLFHNPEELTAQLIDLVRNHQRRERIRQAAYTYVAQNRLLSQHVHKHHEWYCSLLDRRAELHAALKARRPEFDL